MDQVLTFEQGTNSVQAGTYFGSALTVVGRAPNCSALCTANLKYLLYIAPWKMSS